MITKEKEQEQQLHPPNICLSADILRYWSDGDTTCQSRTQQSWRAYAIWQAQESDRSASTNSLFKAMPPKIVTQQSIMSKKNVYKYALQQTYAFNQTWKFFLFTRHPLCLRQATLLPQVLILPPQSAKDETSWENGIVHMLKFERHSEQWWTFQKSLEKCVLNINSFSLMTQLAIHLSKSCQTLKGHKQFTLK